LTGAVSISDKEQTNEGEKNTRRELKNVSAAEVQGEKGWAGGFMGL